MMRADTAALADVVRPLPPPPDGAVVFEASWPVRLGDTDAAERLRLDAIARYVMDLGYEHLEEVEDGDRHPAWLVRRTVIDVLQPITFGDRVHLRRWPSALSNRWFTARIQIRSETGGLVEAEQFLINVDPEAGRPARMTDRFMAPMLEITTEHRLRWKAALQEIPREDGHSRPFPLRVTDLDRYGHVNNAVHWEAVEEGLAAHPDTHAWPYRAVVEHVGPIMAGDEVSVRTAPIDVGLHMQLEVGDSAKTLVLMKRLN
jgi:acyl-ACP thioesterase